MLKAFNVRPLSEDDIFSIIVSAGGKLAYPNIDSHSRLNADYLLGDSIIELKMLDEEGFKKAQRQKKLAALFLEISPERPVVVLDRKVLNNTQQKQYDRIIEGPIKNAVSKGNKQLKQSRKDFSNAKKSILFVLNNGYTALGHDELREMVTHRTRQDTSSIDGVIISGCYYNTDGFDSDFIWPIDYVPISCTSIPNFYAILKREWNSFSDKFMTDIVQGKIACNEIEKSAVNDLIFDVNGVRFVKPGPPMARQSHFYKNGRPRKNTTGLDACPPVAFTVPSLTKTQWEKTRAELDMVDSNFQTYKNWRSFYSKAISSSVPLRPIVPISFNIKKWIKWCKFNQRSANYPSLAQYVTEEFQQKIDIIIKEASEISGDTVLSRPFIMVVTEEIGQDKANDVSRIYKVTPSLKTDKQIVPICLNLKIFHEHAIALAAAYALKNKLNTVRWLNDKKYTWR